MSATNTFETNLLKLIFQNLDLANIGDAAGLQNSAAAGNFYIALFISDPGEAAGGTECSYTSYARTAVVRSSAGWTVSGDNASNAADVTMPACTGGSDTATHFAIFTAATAGDMLFCGELNSPLAITSGVTPQFIAGQLDINVD